MECETPARSGRSSREPAPIQKPSATERTEATRSEITRSPESSSVRTYFCTEDSLRRRAPLSSLWGGEEPLLPPTLDVVARPFAVLERRDLDPGERGGEAEPGDGAGEDRAERRIVRRQRGRGHRSESRGAREQPLEHDAPRRIRPGSRRQRLSRAVAVEQEAPPVDACGKGHEYRPQREGTERPPGAGAREQCCAEQQRGEHEPGRGEQRGLAGRRDDPRG